MGPPFMTGGVSATAAKAGTAASAIVPTINPDTTCLNVNITLLLITQGERCTLSVPDKLARRRGGCQRQSVKNCEWWMIACRYGRAWRSTPEE
ncbi:hypothetical protein AFE_3272 [Acidithiobacillus ferrooxidans ATCC 23270]|uniref:Uncharacterized protein n=1 Tax=Acidithiobacillus ferrooxidans (strain ATCC 23270 / DSM 14882 / CIP 104768 / NCIMB 8455) TaxID=243159 RepID=B7JBF0_ACIF2|nr:hypothetical protein AFE_3272 [Acidithiobacillus ferrooxidans ATCC 23270]